MFRIVGQIIAVYDAFRQNARPTAAASYIAIIIYDNYGREERCAYEKLRKTGWNFLGTNKNNVCYVSSAMAWQRLINRSNYYSMFFTYTLTKYLAF